MSTSHAPRRARRGHLAQRGFSLIEVLIGMVIAMVGIVIMMEVLMTSEQRTRTTGSGNDALSSGAVMLHLLKRDLTQAGYGINALRLLGCTLVLPNGAAIPLAPVVLNPALVPAGDPNTDRLLVFYGNYPGQPEGNPVFTATGTAYTMQAPSSFNVGDYVVATPDACGANLRLTRVTAVTALDISVGVAQASPTIVYNMGQQPRVVAYAVRNGALTSCDFIAADCRNLGAHWVAVAGDIVSLRAQYGRDTTATMDAVVDQWTQTAPVGACQWARSSALRLAVVARSNQMETRIDAGTGQRVRDAVTGAAPAWAGTDVTADNPVAAPIDLSLNPDTTANADWQAYRYRTLETVVPTRNVVWMGVPTGC